MKRSNMNVIEKFYRKIADGRCPPFMGELSVCSVDSLPGNLEDYVGQMLMLSFEEGTKPKRSFHRRSVPWKSPRRFESLKEFPDIQASYRTRADGAYCYRRYRKNIHGILVDLIIVLDQRSFDDQDDELTDMEL